VALFCSVELGRGRRHVCRAEGERPHATGTRVGDGVVTGVVAVVVLLLLLRLLLWRATDRPKAAVGADEGRGAGEIAAAVVLVR
jgi:hypothetical protein